MEFVFYKDTETLYIQTDIGFWKVYLKQELGRYLLYHRNTYSKGMELKDAITGAFHRQGDVRATDSLEFIVEYIIAHDRAKVIMMDDYRKLPRSSRKQKRYFEAAKKKKRREEILRVDAILADLEKERMNVMG